MQPRVTRNRLGIEETGHRSISQLPMGTHRIRAEQLDPNAAHLGRRSWCAGGANRAAEDLPSPSKQNLNRNFEKKLAMWRGLKAASRGRGYWFLMVISSRPQSSIWPQGPILLNKEKLSHGAGGRINPAARESAMYCSMASCLVLERL